ncbi:MAG: PHP domain-containing protein [Spirochaetaceae bacterium]|jgi:hypothetical protein|nr:PHP domain-containing protein [Spirochaetaceae bacterium]
MGIEQTAIEKTMNDFHAAGGERLAALEAFIDAGGLAGVPAAGRESNNHIHTVYSFSPYTPTMAALAARRAGLSVAGSVDHDSYAAAAEMREACRMLTLGCVTGFEVRVSFRHTAFADRKINSPDSKGIAYMTVQGIPAKETARVHEFLRPIVAARQKRNRLMVDALNTLLAPAGIAPLSYDHDVLPLSKADEGGTVTERHILFALSHAFIAAWGKGPATVAGLSRAFGLTFSPKIAAYLADAENPYYAYDLLGALKSGFGDKIYIQPGEEECPPAEKVTAFAASIDAYPAYAYLGDVGESPTGDKKAERFEDAYLDDLMPLLRELGFKAVTYMPPRNTKPQLLRLRDLCAHYGFMEISGVDINSPRQVFNCPELLDEDFANLIETTQVLAEHENRGGHSKT